MKTNLMADPEEKEDYEGQNDDLKIDEEPQETEEVEQELDPVEEEEQENRTVTNPSVSKRPPRKKNTY